ncbi:hypothetical protein F5X99DRAFT_164235 [Biscogniauxia marginata]|nr:hypothetical protein F5X99DRAFT_164235 [Biscogniauxia marginata]
MAWVIPPHHRCFVVWLILHALSPSMDAFSITCIPYISVLCYNCKSIPSLVSMLQLIHLRIVMCVFRMSLIREDGHLDAQIINLIYQKCDLAILSFIKCLCI